MNLSWNQNLGRFEVQFQNFQEEQPVVKEAGFKTDGPPQWVWYSYKTTPLTKLKEKRPTILTINPDAKAEYNRLAVIDQRNAKVKAELAAHKKELKKTLKKKKREGGKSAIPHKPGELFDFIGPEDLPPWVPLIPERKKEPYTGPKCRICDGPLETFFYREDEPLPIACFWCSKVVLDGFEQVC